MITTLLFDFSYTLLLPQDQYYEGSLNKLHTELSKGDDYLFFNNFVLNMELLEFLEELKPKYQMHVFTTGSIQGTPAVKEKLDKVMTNIYTISSIGYHKQQPEAYQEIAKDLGVNIDEVLFIDDMQSNVETAKQAGMNAWVYRSNKELITDLKEL